MQVYLNPEYSLEIGIPILLVNFLKCKSWGCFTYINISYTESLANDFRDNVRDFAPSWDL